MHILILYFGWPRNSDTIVVSLGRGCLVQPHLLWWEVNLAVVFLNEMSVYSEDIMHFKSGTFEARGIQKNALQNVKPNCFQEISYKTVVKLVIHQDSFINIHLHHGVVWLQLNTRILPFSSSLPLIRTAVVSNLMWKWILVVEATELSSWFVGKEWDAQRRSRCLWCRRRHPATLGGSEGMLPLEILKNGSS